MTQRIPSRLADLVEAVNRTFTVLGGAQDFEPAGRGRWIREIGAGWEDPVDTVVLLLDPNADLLTAYVILTATYAPDRRQPLTEAVARANYGLMTGSFEIDLDDDQIRYRGSLPLDIGEVRPEHLSRLVTRALEMTAYYASAFVAVTEGDDPRTAIELVETPWPDDAGPDDGVP